MLSIHWELWRLRGHLILFHEDFCTRQFILGAIMLAWKNKDIGARASYEKFMSTLRWTYFTTKASYSWSMQSPIHYEVIKR